MNCQLYYKLKRKLERWFFNI